MELQPGAEFAGYRIEKRIGRGSSGFVYRARDLRLHRRVALKVLASADESDGEFWQRFERESRLAASIDHPNVIPIYEAGEADGLLYIAMRFVEGTDLKEIIRTGGSLEPRRALQLLRQVADALDSAHAHDLIHSDVKPGNILVYRMPSTGSDEHCYICDFGLSKSARRPTITKSGEAVGTLDYMAPEQIRGEDIDERVDVYALGCVLFECLTGRV